MAASVTPGCGTQGGAATAVVGNAMSSISAGSQGGTVVRVRAKPRASKSRVLEERDGELEIAIAAPPVDGEANAELIVTLAKALGLRKSAVTLASGSTSRHKALHVELAPELVRERLGLR